MYIGCMYSIRLRELTSCLYPKLRIKARPPIMIFQTRVCIEPSKSKKQQSVPEPEKEIQHFSHLSSVQLSLMQPWSTQPQIVIFQTQNKQPIPEERKIFTIYCLILMQFILNGIYIPKAVVLNSNLGNPVTRGKISKIFQPERHLPVYINHLDESLFGKTKYSI